MNAHDLRQLELGELRVKVGMLREELFKVKFQHATAQLSDTSKVGKAKRLFARATTILAEREAAESTPTTA
jgi:large subunit ribosomal protein L29